MDIVSQDESEIIVSPSQMKFTSKNWNQKQRLTIVGVSDKIRDGTQFLQIRFSSSQSRDKNYATVLVPSIFITNQDDGVLPKNGILKSKNR